MENNPILTANFQRTSLCFPTGICTPIIEDKNNCIYIIYKYANSSKKR